MSLADRYALVRDRRELPPLPPQHNLPPSLSALALPVSSPLKRKLVEEEPLLRARTSLAFSNSSHSDMETYHGHVRTPADAIILFEACRVGLLPRVQRRLSEKERQSIKSGSVFVWDEREAGMRRWTDGKSWSASRVSGSFLTYREMEGKRGGGSTGGTGTGFPAPVAVLSRAGRTPDSTHGSESEIDATGEEGPDGYRYKADGLVKQSFSITTSSGNHLHLISYYSRADPASQQLNCPSTDAQLRHIRPAKGMYPESTVHEHQNIPAVTRSPMAGAPYTTTPQMAGYARQGPSQWPQQPYPWPAAPATHPPYSQYYGYQYPSTSGQPLGAATGPSYPQPPQYNAQQPLDRPAPGYEARPQPSHPDHAAFDSRRYPPTPPDSRTGPHHSPLEGADPRARQTSAPYQHQSPYQHSPREAYAPNQGDPRYTGVAQNRESAFSSPRSQAPPSHLAPQQAPSSQGWPPSLLPPPQSDRSTAAAHHQPPPSSHPQTPIDPQLIGTPSHAQSRDIHSNDLNGRPRQDGPPSRPPPSNGYPTAASMIPSIGALVNGSGSEIQRPSHSTATPPISHAPAANGFNSYAAKSETKAPATTPQKQEQAHNFPVGKTGFGEDTRAKGLLDKGFTV